MARFVLWFWLAMVLAIVVVGEISVAVGSPLYTESRWVVNEHGSRVKLACVNWVSHLDAVVAEGLSKQPLKVIAKKIKSMGFNCVRLTWPLYLLTNNSFASLTVRQSFQSLGLNDSIVGIQAKNPHIIDLPLLQAFQEVVKGIGEEDVMVILDNHVTRPGWCCSNTDGNGFFGDQYFKPEEWVHGLTIMASLFRGVSNVVGMSLRNELRGPNQNVDLWYKYMAEGAEAVHKTNPDVLVILSGLNFDTDLSFLKNRPLNLTFQRKQVYEAHWYSFSDGGDKWVSGNLNQVCAQVSNNVIGRWGYLLDQGYPLFLSEFGMDLRDTNLNDVRYFHCFMAMAANLDFDWSLWSLVASYYTREGVVGMIEYFGVLDDDWDELRNPVFSNRISVLQSPFTGPGVGGGNPHEVIFHPLTGLCISSKSSHHGPLTLRPCSTSYGWNYTDQETITKEGNLCLQAPQEVGKPVTLSNQCSSKWEMISDTKMHISSKLGDNSTVCLDVDSNNTIVANACKCLSTDASCDPTSQWFKFVDSTN